MLKLNENVQNLSLVEELSNVKTQTLPHSVSKKETLAKPLYKVYIESELEDSVGQLVATTKSEVLGQNAEKNKAIQLQSDDVTIEDWSEFFSSEGVEEKCDECDSNGVINLDIKSGSKNILSETESVTLADLNESHTGIKTNLSSLEDGEYVVCLINVLTGTVESPSSVEKTTFNGDESDVKEEDIELKVTVDSGVVTLTPNTYNFNYGSNLTATVTVENNVDLCVNIDPTTIYYADDTYTTEGSSIVIKKLDSQNVYENKTIAKLDYGDDGYNKTHTQKNATITKNSNYINGLKIAIYYSVDELHYLTIGTLNPSSCKITLNKNILENESENQALLEKIYNLNITNIECTTINKSEETPSPIVNWNSNSSEIKELHPQDENGNALENLIEGSIRLQIGEIPDLNGDPAQQEGCIILADRPVKEIIDEYDFPRLVLDDTSVTKDGVLNRFKSVSIKTKNSNTEKIFFEKESYSVGHVYYNTGIIELNKEIPIIEGVAPSLRCSVLGMKNLKCNIINKGSDGNKYSLKLVKDHTELNGDVIYDLSLMLNNTDLDVIKCSSNPEGSTIESVDASGNPIDVFVPYIGSLEQDIFTTEYTGDEDELKHLHEGIYNCVNGTDGIAGITAKDYIGYKDESGITGAWLFDNVKYSAQMWPSLGYTDKEFYMAAQDIAWNRKDTTCVWDIPKGLSKKSAIEYREEEPIASNWWTEMYYNWCNDVYNVNVVELPPSYYVTKNSLASYKLNGTWFPVAGKERGTIDAASVINQVPSKLDRDEFITHNINPIFDTGTQGIQIYGNETLNGDYTDLSAAHIARTLTYIRSKVDTYTETLKFELNDVVLWRTWIDYVKSKILEPIKSARGLQWYRVSMGNDTTTTEELANRIVRGIVELQFTPDAEIFKLDYVVYSSAADNTTF